MTSKKNSKPLSRTDQLVVQELDGEVLIYDLSNDRAFCLNSTSAAIWKLCDGDRNVSEIADQIGKELKAKDSEDLVWLALDQLKKEKLVDGLDADYEHFEGLSRRQVVKKIGVGSMIAIPMIMSLVAPHVHAAASTCNAVNPPGTTVGSGGACWCPRGGTPNGSTCGTGSPVGTDPQVATNCKAGCTCTRTQGTQPAFNACSPFGSPNSPTCLGVCS